MEGLAGLGAQFETWGRHGGVLGLIIFALFAIVGFLLWRNETERGRIHRMYADKMDAISRENREALERNTKALHDMEIMLREAMLFARGRPCG